MALTETHHRQDVPRERFEFDGYKAWHSDRGGQDKVTTTSYNVSIHECIISTTKYFYVYSMINRINKPIMLDSFPMQGQCFNLADLDQTVSFVYLSLNND